jgi:hypothetical protein
VDFHGLNVLDSHGRQMPDDMKEVLDHMHACVVSDLDASFGKGQ